MMKNYLITLLISIPFSLCAKLDTTELKKAIERADKDNVTKILKDLTSLPKDDKEFLVAHAEKWATYRKTVIAAESKTLTKQGLIVMLIGASPLLLFLNRFCRNLILRNLEHPVVWVTGILSFHLLIPGSVAFYIGKKNYYMNGIEQESHAIVALIKGIKVEGEV